MSYDLMVFDPDAAPPNHADFMVWYAGQTRWAEGHSYNDPAVTMVRLREWFLEIAKTFPPMNGPMAKEELPKDEASATDYSIGRKVIYAAFAWSKTEAAYKTVFDLAARHQVGFFNVSSGDQEVWLPKDGKLVLAHQKASTLKGKLRNFLNPS